MERPRAASFAVTGLIGAAALAILLFPSSVTYVAGLPETRALAPPDAVLTPEHETPMALLLERDSLDLTIRTPTRLDRFLELNRLRRQRQQIRAQLHLSPATADDQYTIAAGTTLHLKLTPEAPDVPGAKPLSGESRP